ncbi:hypothetical protein BKA93DRAFT_269774 [Sparassis latifolia]
MRTWSWSEIYAARDMQRPKRIIDINELRVTFTKFSHTAWVVYLTHTRGQERAIAYALGSLSPHLLASLIRQDHSVEADIYSQLVEVNPYVGSDGQVRREIIRENIATQSIRGLLVKQTATVQDVELRRTCEALYAQPESRASAGTAFKLAAHAVMMHQSERNVRSLSDDRGRKQDVLQGHLYCRPGVLNFPGIDSFTFVNGSPVVFLMTVAPSHPVKISGLEHVSSLLGATNIRSKQWSLVFIVPRGNVDAFAIQPMNPPHKRKSWEHRVHQYVLGLDHNELWPTT